jgi:hypothetical protein
MEERRQLTQERASASPSVAMPSDHHAVAIDLLVGDREGKP